jgi:hypothetical protein
MSLLLEVVLEVPLMVQVAEREVILLAQDIQ